MSDTSVCECGRKFTSKSGLTIHKKTCKALHPQKPSNGDRPPQPLSSSDRQQYTRLINRRQETILKALVQELESDPEHIYAMLRQQRGQIYTSEQLKEVIDGIEGEIQAEVEKHMAGERHRIHAKQQDIIDSYEEKERELKRKQKEEFKLLLEEKKKAKEAIREEQRNIEKTIVEKYALPLYRKKEEAQRKLAEAKSSELEIKAQADQRIAIVKRSKDRLEHTVRDATGRALEGLMTAADKGEAQALLESIPTVAEAIQLCSSAEGIEQLFRRLDPSMPMLPEPSSEVKDVTGSDEDIEIILPSDNEDEDEEEDFDWANEEREREINRVRREVSV